MGDLARNEVLELQQDTLLNSKELTLNAAKVIDHYDSTVLFHGRVTPEKFKANSGIYWPELHLVTKGTRVRCVKLERFFSFEFSEYIVWVEILDGDFKGQIVGLSSDFVLGVPDKKGSLHLYTASLRPVQ